MNKEELFDLIKFTYEKTIKDNKEDFLRIFEIVSKLCLYLGAKNILNENDIKDILNIEPKDSELNE